MGSWPREDYLQSMFCFPCRPVHRRGANGYHSPALFAGYDKTPKHAVEQFINLSLDYGFIYPLLYVSSRLFSPFSKLLLAPSPVPRLREDVDMKAKLTPPG